MARFATQLSSFWPRLLLVALPLLLGGSVLAWLVSDHKSQPLNLSDVLMAELLDAQTGNNTSSLNQPEAAADLVIPPRGSQPHLAIRVMLHSGPGPVRVNDAQRDNTLNCRRGQLTLASQPIGLQRWFEAAPGQSIGFDGQQYRGRLQLICQGARVTVVNHVALEDYISSVVGAEMPSHWPAEALRAQAVAARSYAMAHLARPANRSWNLGDTTRWQAYGGIGSESRTSRAAAVDTQGLILSFEGGIVESLYASDRQLTVEAHGHLGASMSQHGARTLASKGYQFTQILAKYYPGASLARLQRS